MDKNAISPNSFYQKARDHSLSLNDLFHTAESLLSDGNSNAIHSFLELGHLPEINETLTQSGKTEDWFNLLERLILHSNFQVRHLLEQRAKRYGDKPYLRWIKGEKLSTMSYSGVLQIVRKIGLSLEKYRNKKLVVGIFTPNTLNGALVDLACLSYNIPVVPIPANLSPEHLKYILHHSEMTHVFIGGQKPYSTLKEARIKSDTLVFIHLNEAHPVLQNGVTWENFLTLSKVNQCEMIAENTDFPATIMYTSGTTDNPKGIIFTQNNIITKRFARALALPQIGPKDHFLCFLPLFHTFGRWFELLGTLFWGASYTFTESTSFKVLLKDFSIAKPTVLISIPKRWIQIQEYVGTQVSLERSSENVIKNAVRDVTGGHLKWGLSAAGYLDPDTFKFFQRNGIQLLSGYGMTEATGGITMTPPYDYVPDSVGKALPGINLKLNTDNELLLKGPYVSPGYFKPESDEPYLDGWFHTGDIFQEKKGHYFIVDRKKEIYKNTRGQTISPQKIENLFQDFDAIKSVFLVGDGCEYNTVLLYPDPEFTFVDLSTLSEDEIRTYFSSLVFSVNSFLPAYERIVNYAIIHRNFDSHHGELTPKGTYKRKTILKNFRTIIDPMYEKNFISLIHGEKEIQLPNWLLREKKLMRGDISWDGQVIREYGLKNGLRCHWNETIQLGDFTYKSSETVLNIEKLLQDPTLWLGNGALADFVGSIGFRVVSFEPVDSLQLNLDALPFSEDKSTKTPKDLATAIRKHTPSLKSLHLAAVQSLKSTGFEEGMSLSHLSQALNDTTLNPVATQLLLRLQHHPSIKIRIKVLEILLPQLSGEMFLDLLQEIILASIDDSDYREIDITFLTETHCKTLLKALVIYRGKSQLKKQDVKVCTHLLSIVSRYGIIHPVLYSKIRSELASWTQTITQQTLKKESGIHLKNLTKGFRTWLGPPLTLAIDRDTGKEYQWDDVIVFDENVSDDLRQRIRTAIHKSTLIREAVFLFTQRHLIQLEDIRSQGVWVTFLGKAHGKSVVRVLVQTRELESFNLVINLNESLSDNIFNREIYWLMVTGSSIHGDKLVEDFGGFWPEYGLFTEEYISGETVQQYLERKKEEIEAGNHPDRWQMRWLHFIWNGVTAYLEFWNRSGCTRFIKEPSPKNVIIPEFDYTVGTRLISISDRIKEPSLSTVLGILYRAYIIKTEKLFPGLHRMAEWEILLTVVLEVFGQENGSSMLQSLAVEIGEDPSSFSELKLTKNRINKFIKEIDNSGLLPKQIVFAALRYQRWLDLNPEATKKARGTIIQELYKDYNLRQVSEMYPETRLRFFLMTAFRESHPILLDHLSSLMNQMRKTQLTEEDFSTQLHLIHDQVELSPDDQYFMTRLVYEHVDAADYAELISREMGMTGRLDLVVLVEDNKEEQFRIRPPFHPKEVARFHALLLESNLSVQFRVHHEFLLIIDKKDHLAGGVYWKDNGSGIAHLEKVVIAPHYRRRNLSIILIEELFHRLKPQFNHLTVGFFQAGLFYKLGFQIDKKYGGLVKHF